MWAAAGVVLTHELSPVQATKLDAKAPLPLYGLAQIMVRQREYTNAVSLLESALAQARALRPPLPELHQDKAPRVLDPNQKRH